jgi:hypothetical protein
MTSKTTITTLTTTPSAHAHKVPFLTLPHPPHSSNNHNLCPRRRQRQHQVPIRRSCTFPLSRADHQWPAPFARESDARRFVRFRFTLLFHLRAAPLPIPEYNAASATRRARIPPRRAGTEKTPDGSGDCSGNGIIYYHCLTAFPAKGGIMSTHHFYAQGCPLRMVRRLSTGILGWRTMRIQKTKIPHNSIICTVRTELRSVDGPGER